MVAISRFGRNFAPLYERWRADIKLFAREGLNLELTWQQEELLDLVQLESWLPVEKRLKRIAVKSGQGPGKTLISVVVALWRCLRYPDALCIVTSPSMRQCKQWIDESKRILRSSHPILQGFIKCYTTRVEINGEDIWGIKTATATRPENLQGIHEERLTFIADEASGVSRAIIETIKGTLSNPDALFLMIGNPNTSDCAFFDCFTTQADQWHTLTFNAEDTARDYPNIVSPSRNKALALEYGIDSDVYRVRVLGEFPHEDPNSLMNVEDLFACTKTSLVGCAGITDILPFQNCISLDYARYGSDESCVARRRGLAVVDYDVFVKRDPREVTDHAFKTQYDAGWKDDQCWYIPDAGGMGQGILHSFHEAGKQVYEFHNGGRAADTAMFADQISEAWWNFRMLVRERIVHLPNDARLLKQLSTRQYYMDRKGKIVVETKDEWRKRTEIEESPDRAETIVMAFYPHVGIGGQVAKANPRGRIVGISIRRRD